MKIARSLCTAIESRCLTKEELISCIIALGCICDQRTSSSPLDSDTITKALQTIDAVHSYSSEAIISSQNKASTVASKMINGNAINLDEEQFLLTKLEI